MLKRAFFVFAVLWAGVFLANGATKVNGIGEGDVWLALAPVTIGWLLVRAGRFVLGTRRP